jgi:hypothetical protein
MSSSLTRFETRHGRTFEVETLPSKAAPSKTRQREADLFVKVPLQWADAATKAIGSRQCFILIWLLHIAWKTKSTTFTLSNEALVRYGISREVKRKALDALETASLIKVDQLPGRAPVVTLLVNL